MKGIDQQNECIGESIKTWIVEDDEAFCWGSFIMFRSPS